MRRAKVQWQLALVVASIAVIACTLISSLGLLVAATELGAVRGALTNATEAETTLTVNLKRPSVPTTEVRDVVEPIATEVLGDAAETRTLTLALSELYAMPREFALPALLYFGEFDALDENVTLVSGEWPNSPTEVAIPDVGADVLGYAVGDSIPLFGTMTTQNDVTVTISGVYHIDDSDAHYWGEDLLTGAGLNPHYPVPGSGGAAFTDAVGPLIVPDGTLDAEGIMVERVALNVIPDFSTTTVESLAPLQERLAVAPEAAPADIGNISYRVHVSSRLGTLVDTVTATMAVTRSIVVVVSLLLFVLAVAALGQAARLLTEARLGERHLMRARGASNRQNLGLASGEALAIAALTAVASPFIARGVYLLVAQQPSMVAAGMSGDPGIPPLVWVVSIAIGALFWVVMIAPMLGREASFHEGEQGNARQKRLSGLQRSGVDIVLLVLAGVAYSQLLAYKGPTSSTQLGIDPILVAGPALVLLAGAFLAVRLIPAAGALTERIASRSTGAVVSLAAWEIGRRAQRATAAILLITLALSVGTFSLSFLSTWRQSQIDQAVFALGAPLRLTTTSDIAVVPQSAQPVIRESGAVAGAYDFSAVQGGAGEDAAVLGLTDDSRDLLLRGRLGDEGGAIIAESISKRSLVDTAIPLPDDTLGISATVKITGEKPIDAVSTRLRVLLQDDYDHQFIIDMGMVQTNDKEYKITGTLSDGQARNGLSLVGFQLTAFVGNPVLDGATKLTRAQLVVRDLASMGTPDASTPAGGYPSRPLEVDPQKKWRASGTGENTKYYPMPLTPEGWQLGLGFAIPDDLASQAATYALTGWATVNEMPAVLSQPLAEALDAEISDHLVVFVLGTAVNAYVVAITPSVPGGGASHEVSSLGTIGKDAANTIVLDQVQLSRALFQHGVTQPTVNEWWMEAPEGDPESYLAYLAVQYDTVTPQSAEALGQRAQDDPLRVATQGALWLVIAGSAALAAVGFAVHATGSLRSRATEFAQLRAVGLSRRRLVGIIGIESLLLCVLGTIFGIGLGLVLAFLVGPLVGVSGDGSPPIPSVVAVIPGAQIAVLAGILAVVLAIVVVVAARVQRVAEPASALRRGEER